MPDKSRGKTILVIEDEPDLRQFASWALEADSVHRGKTLEMGAADYLIKPLNAEVLRECMIQMLPQV